MSPLSLLPHDEFVITTMTLAATVRHIVNPTDKEIETCTDVLHEAFGRSYFISGLGMNQALVRPCIRAHLMAGFIGGEIHVAELPDIGIIGVAMWFGPGQTFFSTPEQRAGGWDDILNEVGDTYRQWWDYLLSFSLEMANKYYGAGVQLDSYNLKLLGVHPEYQKQGHGTALFNFVEPKAAAESRSVVLETVGESAVPFYKALGYTVFGPTDLKTADGKILAVYWFQKKFV